MSDPASENILGAPVGEAELVAGVAEVSLDASPSPAASSSPAPAVAAAASSSSSAAPTPSPSPLGKSEPFPWLYKYHTDTEAVAASLPAGSLEAVKEREYTEAEVALMESLREAVAAMMADPAQMVATADDYPGGMHQHWTTHWPEGKNHAHYVDRVSAADADPASWPQHELIRFLRARGMDLKKATKMYFHYRRWRLVFGASHIASLPSAPWEPLIGTILSASYHKWDKHHRPLYIQKSGSIDVNRFITEVSTDKIGVGHTWFTEEMKKRAGVGSQMKGERVTELVMIVDIANLGLSARKLVKIFSLTSYIDQNFLPEYMGCLYIINAPSFFPVIFSLAKAFLSAETQKKIKILNHKYAATLVEDLGADCLPVEYGGVCVCEQGCCPVPSGVAPPKWEEEGSEEETINLKAGASASVELPLVAQVDGVAQEAFWILNVAAKDIDFSVEFRPTPESSSAADNASAAASSSSASSAAVAGDAPEAASFEVVPVTRVVASGTATMGSYSSAVSGVLHLNFSNAYSRWTGKTLTIRTGTRNKLQPQQQ